MAWLWDLFGVVGRVGRWCECTPRATDFVKKNLP